MSLDIALATLPTPPSPSARHSAGTAWRALCVNVCGLLACSTSVLDGSIPILLSIDLGRAHVAVTEHDTRGLQIRFLSELRSGTMPDLIGIPAVVGVPTLLRLGS